MSPTSSPRSAERPHQTATLRILAQPARKNHDNNPYQYLLYSALERRGHRVEEFDVHRALTGRYDIYHLHWPDALVDQSRSRAEAIVKALTLRVLVDLQRWRGARVVWTAHNLHSQSQRYPGVERWLWDWLLPRLDGVVYLTEASIAPLEAGRPGLAARPGVVVPHGHYRGWYPATIDRFEARRRLGLADDEEVILFLGGIGPHKQVDRLLAAFAELDRPRARLVIAGRLATVMETTDAGQRFLEEVRRHPRVVTRLGFLPEDELQVFLRAADLVVQPSTSGINSGSAILALSFDQPVLMHDGPAAKEARRLIGAEWVRTFTPPLTSATLAAALDWALARSGGEAPLEALEWDGLAATTEAFYRRLVRREATAPSPSDPVCSRP